MPRFTFRTSKDLRIRMTFHAFIFGETGEFLEIGDGPNVKISTQLARFNGTGIPNDVVSITNAVWIIVKISCGVRMFSLNITVAAEDKTGMI